MCLRPLSPLTLNKSCLTACFPVDTGGPDRSEAYKQIAGTSNPNLRTTHGPLFLCYRSVSEVINSEGSLNKDLLFQILSLHHVLTEQTQNGTCNILAFT